MVKPNDNPRVADGDYGEGDNDLNNEPGDLAIIQLPLPAPGLLAHQVPMYICYNPHVHGVRQIDNDSQEVNAQYDERCFGDGIFSNAERVEHGPVPFHSDGGEGETGDVHRHIQTCVEQFAQTRQESSNFS